MRFYVGTYTGVSKGIYLFDLDAKTGALTSDGLVAETPNPSFLAIAPGGKYLYAANELGEFQGKQTGAISAFAIEPKSGQLRLLNQVDSHGTAPCHIVTDRAGKHVLAANYSSGSVTVVPIAADGSLGAPTATVQHHGSSVDPGRQEGPHAHSINLDAANRFALVADLGLDKVLVYRYDAAKGTLTPNAPPSADIAPGSGPRHLAFTPDGHFAYVISEMKNTVTTLTYDAAKGFLEPKAVVSTLPTDFTGTSYTAEIAIHPNGRFLYGSNRGHDSIACFAVDAKTGGLTEIGIVPTEGKNPRNFAIDPTGAFLIAANQDSDSLVVFRIDPATGHITPTGRTATVPKPVCIRFMP